MLGLCSDGHPQPGSDSVTVRVFSIPSFRLIDALWQHEIVEIRLSEEDPDIDFLNAQILTTFFE